jgi:cupin 2 domain-containing protein
VRNLFRELPAPGAAEAFETLAEGGRFRLERIVSAGHASPPGEWYNQAAAEWVVLLTGSAGLRFEDEAEARTLAPGDWCSSRPIAGTGSNGRIQAGIPSGSPSVTSPTNEECGAAAPPVTELSDGAPCEADPGRR